MQVSPEAEGAPAAGPEAGAQDPDGEASRHRELFSALKSSEICSTGCQICLRRTKPFIPPDIFFL